MTQEIISNEKRTMLAPFGSRAELGEFSDRLRRTYKVKLKGGETRSLTISESLRFASACLSHGLDPYTGEIWGSEGKDGDLVIKVGRNGWTKAIVTQLRNEGGGNHWAEYRQIVDEGERALLMIPKGALAFECRLFDTPSIRSYSEAVERLSKAGASWAEIKDALGSRPYSIGLGVYSTSDSTKYQDAQYPPIERAKKRAYEAATKYRFSLPFDEVEGTDELPAQYTGKMLSDGKRQTAEEIIDGNKSGDYRPNDEEIDAALALKQKREAGSKALFGEG